MEALGLLEKLKHAITVYTGLTPITFFTILSVLIALYYWISGLFGIPEPRRREIEEKEPLPPPVQLGEITEEELKTYDGSDPKKPLLMAIKGQIYDVTLSSPFYGPGGPYALFAGKDASRALAKMSFEEKDLNGDISDLGPFELDTLQDWEYKFMSKYVKVGTLKKPISEESGSSEKREEDEEKSDSSEKREEDGEKSDSSEKREEDGETSDSSEKREEDAEKSGSSEKREDGEKKKDFKE